MTTPHPPESDSPSRGNTFPQFTLTNALPALLLAWGLGAALTLMIRTLGQSALSDPCAGHGLLALFMPLLLGPGGIALTFLHKGSAQRAAFGLGLVLASLVPALLIGAQDMGKLRQQGCAGGYIVLSQSDAKAKPNTVIKQGETRQLMGRIGGFNSKTHPDPFELKSASNNENVIIILPQKTVMAGQSFPVQIKILENTPLNTYKAGVEAVQKQDGKTIRASGTLEIDVRPK